MVDACISPLIHKTKKGLVKLQVRILSWLQKTVYLIMNYAQKEHDELVMSSMKLGFIIGLIVGLIIPLITLLVTQ